LIRSLIHIYDLDTIHRLRALWHPERYHGWGRTRRYFEGWYYKCVSPDEREALAFIPGIAMNAGGERHCFVQVMDGHRFRAEYFRFPGNAFRPAADRFAVEVDRNFFSGEKLVLDLPEIRGELRFVEPAPWPKMLGAPGIMGWYSFVPGMQCFHGVVSLDHALEGRLHYHGAEIDFTGGRGYIEKDWGRSFPRGYVWMQSNHFRRHPGTSLLASVAHIPWVTGYFIGFICGFWFERRLYRFATYTGAEKHLELGPDSATLIFRDRRRELRLHARQAAGVALQSPLSGEMTGKINESLQATVATELFEGGRRIFEDTGFNTGLELAGDLEVLLT
jgi:tocopherol cyclase